MILTIVFLSIIIILLLLRLYKKRSKIDFTLVLKNREEMFLFAQQEWKNGEISKNEYRLLATFFHPDFKNIWDYKPMENSKLRIEEETLDSNFWKYYKITPDFTIPAGMVYGLYKDFIIKNIESYPLIRENFKI